MDDIISYELLRGAVMRKMFCACGIVLDVDSAVLVSSPNRSAVVCAACFDKAGEKLGSPPKGVEVIDGRKV